ncbi:major facilitator superfamily domain-containing protein [Aspergillus ambiguus]|uniref:major facilitator superfamily domain-containing protein n=1 Tax=Aspergillus ambiguus TaxID=176160 RepID=UPI003CCDB741
MSSNKSSSDESVRKVSQYGAVDSSGCTSTTAMHIRSSSHHEDECCVKLCSSGYPEDRCIRSTGRLQADQFPERARSVCERDAEDCENDRHDTQVTWSSLPNKMQLLLLGFTKFSEVVAQSSLHAFMFHQLKSFDPSLSESQVSSQTGMLQGVLTAAQIVSAIVLGRLADVKYIGRKKILLLGLTGYAVSSVGLGFSKTFFAAALFRTVGGALNGNSGLIRAILAELIREKKYQSRGFLLIPLCSSIGATVGPLLGGALADPIHSYPSVFGPGSRLGGKDGVLWMDEWPYALPCVVGAAICSGTAILVAFFLEETLVVTHNNADGLDYTNQSLSNCIHSSEEGYPYHLVPSRPSQEGTEEINEDDNVRSCSPPHKPASTTLRSAGFRILLIPNVILTLISHFLFYFHMTTHETLYLIFLPAPRAPPATHGLHFAGGLGLPSAEVGLAMSITGFIGLPLSILVYPRVSAQLGTLRSYRIFLPLALIAYALTPFLVLVPDRASVTWSSLVTIMLLNALASTFTSPASVIVLNNCIMGSPGLATVHGVGESVASAANTLGPLFGGWFLGIGLRCDMVALVWWSLVLVGLSEWGLLWKLQAVD